MAKHIVAILVNNQFGVLNRVTSMFRRRQFNISTLTVSETENKLHSRITVTFGGEERLKQQLINQLYKLPDVISVEEFDPENAVSYELLLIKMKNEQRSKQEIMSTAEVFNAKIVDFTKDSIILRLTDDSRRIDDFITIMCEYTVLEICRTGIVSLGKGGVTIRETVNL